MSKKTARMNEVVPEGWLMKTEITINGRKVDTDTELSIKGVRGRHRFIREVTRENGTTYIDVMSAEPHKMIRSFHIDKVRTVHRIPKTRENQEKTA